MIDTYCGLKCTTCTFRDACHCSGCIATGGHPFHGECPVAICCREKGHGHCGQCAEFPCELLDQYSCDPEHGDTPPGARIEVCRGWNRQEAVLANIRARHSYRGKYLPIAVPREDLAAIMEAGLAAPSGCNTQTTSLVAVDDPELLATLLGQIDPPVAQTAPAMICVLTQRVCAYRDKCFAVQDYSAAIENMLLAITALGYASCWFEGHITDDDRIGDKLAATLGVPAGYELVCILPVGVPEKQPTAPTKRPFDARAAFNRFPGK